MHHQLNNSFGNVAKKYLSLNVYIDFKMCIFFRDGKCTKSIKYIKCIIRHTKLCVKTNGFWNILPLGSFSINVSFHCFHWSLFIAPLILHPPLQEEEVRCKEGCGITRSSETRIQISRLPSLMFLSWSFSKVFNCELSTLKNTRAKHGLSAARTYYFT